MGYIKDLIIRIKGDSSPLKKETKKAEGTLQGFSKNVKSIGAKMGAVFGALGAAIGAAFAVRAMGKLASDSVRLYDQQIKALTKVQQAVTATGGAAGLTAQELAKTASELQAITTFGDEDILGNVTAQLLTFTNIGQDEFKRTQMAALDLATMLDGDLKSATIQLGKALNDPMANLSALSKSVVQFSEQQKTTIKRLAETNNLAAAQNLILDELNRKYGGQAEAQAKVGLGPWKQIKNDIGDMKEEFGKGLMPIITKFGIYVKDLLPKIAAGFRAAGAWVRNLANGFIDVYNNSLVLRVAITFLGDTIKTIFATAKLAIQQAFLPIATIGKVIGAVLKGQFKDIPNILKEQFSKGVDNYKEFGTKAVNNFAGSIKKARENFINPLTPTPEDQAVIIKSFADTGAAAGAALEKALTESVDFTGLQAKIEALKVGSIKIEATPQAEGPKRASSGEEVKPQSVFLQQLAAQVDGYLDLRDAIKEVEDAYPNFSAAGIDSFKALDEALIRHLDMLDRIPLSLQEIEAAYQKNMTTGQSMMLSLETAAVSFGEAMIQAGLDSEDGLRGFAVEAKKVAKEIIARELALGVAAVVRGALYSVPFPFNLAIAGVAGGAAAALFNSAVPSFAEGGFVKAPTLAMVGDNPSGRGEYIIPAEKMNMGGGRLYTEIDGRKLRIILDRENDFRNRT